MSSLEGDNDSDECIDMPPLESDEVKKVNEVNGNLDSKQTINQTFNIISTSKS